MATRKLGDRIDDGNLVVKYRGNFKGGNVGLFFQKMNWLSRYADPPLGDVWILSVVFQDRSMFAKPPLGANRDYTSFLDMLNETPANDGPLQTFMNDMGVTSLFSVDVVGATPPNRRREISWLELVARDGTWVPANGTWDFRPAIIVDNRYVGSAGNRIPQLVLDYWGSGSFALIEGRFTP